MVVREGDDDESDESDEGMVSARRAFVPPLRVTLERDGVERPMRSFVWREGSCASCHQADEAVDSPGRIVLEDSP
jgi:hypothetical protein